MEEKQLNPEAKKRLERYNKALLHEDGTLEHELATYMDTFPSLKATMASHSHRTMKSGARMTSPTSSSRTIPTIPLKMRCTTTAKRTRT